MIIPYPRVRAAIVRLSRHKLRLIEREIGPLSELEKVIMMRRALFPWAGVTLVKRLWARGHIVIEPSTREIMRGPS